MITYTTPYLVYHEGEWINFFILEYLIANAEIVWNKNRGYVTGVYDDEFDFATEEDPFITETIDYVIANGDNTTPDTRSTRPIPERFKRIFWH